eukprot:3541722-Amphidinium_carterae.1
MRWKTIPEDAFGNVQCDVTKDQFLSHLFFGSLLRILLLETPGLHKLLIPRRAPPLHATHAQIPAPPPTPSHRAGSASILHVCVRPSCSSACIAFDTTSLVSAGSSLREVCWLADSLEEKWQTAHLAPWTWQCGWLLVSH